MKKLLFLSFLFLCSISTIQAQFSLGVDGGVNFNGISDSNSDKTFVSETKAYANYYIGIRPTYAISSKINIGLGLQYSLKGYESSSELSSVKIRNYYLDALPQIEFRPIELLGLVGGFNIGYRTDTAVKVDDKWEENLILSDAFEKTDIGLLLGLKLYVKQFYLTAHFNQGITKISEITFTDANGEDLLSSSRYNQNIQIGVGYQFEL